MELLELWQARTPLIAAVIARLPLLVERLLNAGASPTAAVRGAQREHSALSLTTQPTTPWGTGVCMETATLIERSLVWSPSDLKAHKLFPPGFRRGVKHVCGLRVALCKAGRVLPEASWLLIISHLPRDWEFHHSTCP